MLAHTRAAGLIALVMSFGEISAAQPTAMAVQAQIPKELTQQIALTDFREERLTQLLDRLVKKTGVHIGLDAPGLETLCKKSLKYMTIIPPPGSLPLGAALEFVASQIHGTLRERNRQWRIVPGRADITRFVSPPTEATHKATRRMVEIEKQIAGAAAKDIGEFFSEKYDIRIVVAPSPYDTSAKFEDKQCNLPRCKKPLIELVNDVARQIGGDVRIYKELILIVPQDRSQS